MSKKGILLINIGTPADCTAESVGEYLKTFLMDPYVIDMPFLLRYILVNLIIVPRRKSLSAQNYKRIWLEEGSPLLVYSKKLKRSIEENLDYQVALGMRYSDPCISAGLQELSQSCDEIIVLPLYPQYAESTTKSSLEQVTKWKHESGWSGNLKIINEFYSLESFVKIYSEFIRSQRDLEGYDHVLFSYHGLPQSHIKKLDNNNHCQFNLNCCAAVCEKNRLCYRAQCMETSRLIAKELNLKSYSHSFQSRLGKAEWIKPYTNEHIEHLLEQGHKKLLVITPSFIIDCLETIDEIGQELRHEFLAKGGQVFDLMPALNDHFSNVVAELVKP